MSLLLLLSLAVLGAPSAPDTLVVCPAEFRPALVAWESYRRGQGHEILVVDPPDSAEELRATIRRASAPGRLRYLVLVGDVPVRGRETRAQQSETRAQQTETNAQQSETRAQRSRAAGKFRTTIATNYVAAKINTRWGSEPQIASDTPYADTNGDGLPDIAVGRIPADSVDELAAVVRKVLRYEQQSDHGPWERRLNIVSGVGGFGAVTDALVEAAGKQVIQQTVPPEYTVQHTCARSAGKNGTPAGMFGARAREQLNEGPLAWIYLGHGRPSELDHIPAATGDEAILSVSDVPRLRCGVHSPLAVLVACYTGAMDAPRDCLAEELLLADEGPIAVIAATRVTMPYGNTVLGYELLRACFHDRPIGLGDSLRMAQQRTLAPSANDPMRASLDSMAAGLSPSPVDLVGERREHVLMYHLFGDPLLRLHRPEASVAQAGSGGTVTK